MPECLVVSTASILVPKNRNSQPYRRTLLRFGRRESSNHKIPRKHSLSANSDIVGCIWGDFAGKTFANMLIFHLLFSAVKFISIKIVSYGIIKRPESKVFQCFLVFSLYYNVFLINYHWFLQLMNKKKGNRTIRRHSPCSLCILNQKCTIYWTGVLVYRNKPYWPRS